MSCGKNLATKHTADSLSAAAKDNAVVSDARKGRGTRQGGYWWAPSNFGCGDTIPLGRCQYLCPCDTLRERARSGRRPLILLLLVLMTCVTVDVFCKCVMYFAFLPYWSVRTLLMVILLPYFRLKHAYSTILRQKFFLEQSIDCLNVSQS